LRDHEAELRALGASVAAVGLGDLRYAQHFREETGIGFPLLIDEGRAAYRAAGLESATPLDLFKPANFRARKRAKAGGHRQHRLGKDPFQLGGSFVFAPGDRDLYAHRSATFGDNAPVEEMVAAIRGRRP